MINDKLQLLYRRIPNIDCFKCGQCCCNFTPTFGIAEFISFLESLVINYPENKIKEILPKPIFTAGCRFLGKDNLCLVWRYRPFACRIFGITVSYENEIISDYSNRCFPRQNHKLTSQIMSLKDFNLLNKKLDEINQKYISASAPFWLRGLTFKSWISLYVADSLKNAYLKRLQRVLHKNLDLKFLSNGYPAKDELLLRFEKLIQAQELFYKSQYEETLLEFTLLRKDNPDDYAIEETLFFSGICMEKIGNLVEAEEIYRLVLRKTLYRLPVLAAKVKKRIKCLQNRIK